MIGAHDSPAFLKRLTSSVTATNNNRSKSVGWLKVEVKYNVEWECKKNEVIC